MEIRDLGVGEVGFEGGAGFLRQQRVVAGLEQQGGDGGVGGREGGFSQCQGDADPLGEHAAPDGLDFGVHGIDEVFAGILADEEMSDGGFRRAQREDAAQRQESEGGAARRGAVGAGQDQASDAQARRGGEVQGQRGGEGFGEQGEGSELFESPDEMVPQRRVVLGRVGRQGEGEEFAARGLFPQAGDEIVEQAHRSMEAGEEDERKIGWVHVRGE